jgi:hypothetical protein
MTNPDPPAETASEPPRAAGFPPGQGYAQPDADQAYPGRYGPSRGRTWLGTLTALAVVAVIAGVAHYALDKSSKWRLTAPPTVAGMHRTSAAAELGFTSLVSRFSADVRGLPDYGKVTSTVSALYTLNANEAVGFIGFNGTFNVQIVLKSGSGLTVSRADPGPHGGVAECGTADPNAICQWSTSSTVGIVIVLPTSLAPVHESAATTNRLMLSIRNDVEQSAGHS